MVKQVRALFAILLLASFAVCGEASASVVDFNGAPSTSWADGSFSSGLTGFLPDGFAQYQSPYEAFNLYGVSGESIMFNQPTFLQSFDLMPFVGHTFWSVPTVVSEYDINGQLLGQQVDDPTSTSFTTFDVELSNVSSIVFTHNSPYYNGDLPNAAWFLVQNITYDSQTSPVPEPGTVVLLGAGLIGLAIYGKRRRTA